MTKLLEKSGGRKFASLIIGLAAVGIQYTAMSIIIGKEFAISSFSNFVLGICGLVACYITGNAVVNFSKNG